MSSLYVYEFGSKVVLGLSLVSRTFFLKILFLKGKYNGISNYTKAKIHYSAQKVPVSAVCCFAQGKKRIKGK